MMRRGSLLIIAAGLAAIVASMALAFLVRSNQDADSSRRTTHAIQVRLMLAAACQYIQESSRIGWDLSPWSTPRWSDVYPGILDPENRIHEEAFGWIDVRDGSIGPRTLDYDGDGVYDPRFSNALVEATGNPASPFRPAWPAIGSVCRAPMEVWQRPPYAISLNATPNPIANDPADPWFGLPLLRNPDPQPARVTLTGTDPASVLTRWNDFRMGDVLPSGAAIIRPESRNLGWFRVHRDGPATFVITVGSGATRGFKDWPEVIALNGGSAFADSQEVFADLVAAEIRLWYRVEWSAAVSVQAPIGASSIDTPQWINLFGRTNSSQNIPTGTIGYDVQPWTLTRNHGGTISYIQRLRFAPERW